MAAAGTGYLTEVSHSLNGNALSTLHSASDASFNPMVSSNNQRQTPEGSIGLKRRIGLMSGASLIVGTMIGSGIFVSPKGVLQRSGSVGMSLLVWTGCGLLSLLGIITFINCFSVQLATQIQNICTVAKLSAVAIIVVGGAVKLSQGHIQHFNKGFEGTSSSFSDIATAFYSGLWAYDGWNNLNYITEELVNPFVNLPRAIYFGIPLVTVCYVLINISYLTVMSTTEVLASEAVAMTWASRVLGVMAFLMPLTIAISTFGAGNGTDFTTGRLTFVAAREGHLVGILSYVHIRRFTPSPALITNAILAICMIIPGNIGSLIDFFSFTAWLFYGATMTALVVLRWKKKDIARPYKVPLVVPFVVMAISAYLVLAPIIQQPQIEYLYALLFIVSGLILYVPFVHYKLELRIMDKITVFLQLLLEVTPTSPITS
ncbi:b(0,+)-type amino acid transporter 1-like isoform X3 [Limulus polyphemus]|uniref:B(0,+)-type amino acid transporter 1-like isoform X3 n=1 Tax=Limulus polyphemus TaxID=6850 RepID=A0ABM1SL12_LIMPO|nr:b(0,+)-type amino acid transporter 1-like isoform X3 [Limulus polyphemus]